jgi:hypothetical protein
MWSDVADRNVRCGYLWQIGGSGGGSGRSVTVATFLPLLVVEVVVVVLVVVVELVVVLLADRRVRCGYLWQIGGSDVATSGRSESPIWLPLADRRVRCG